MADKNTVALCGEILDSKPIFDYIHNDTCFYLLHISVHRRSNTEDIVPVIFRDDMINVFDNYKGVHVKVEGKFISRNVLKDKKRKLILGILAEKAEFIYESNFCEENYVELECFLCKEPIFRKTPFGKEICDLIVANNSSKGTHFIPCICWGGAARWAAGLSIGTKVFISGRIQSREYQKNGETRIAYELSVKDIGEIEHENSRVETNKA